MMLKSLLLTTAFVAAATGVASAAPLLQYNILDGVNLIGSGFSVTGNIINGGGSDNNFNVSLSTSGAPFLTVPDFSTNSFSVSSGVGAGVLTIEITDTGLTGYAGGNVANTFNINSLNGGGFTSGTISNYFDMSNTPYGTGTLLGTSSFSGKNSFSNQTNTSASLVSGTFSETTIYVLNYASDGNGTVSASSQLSSTSVPEPISIALLGTSLVGVGLFRSRQRGN
jgi:hypothetical protein